jgi:hypothetical protein
MRYDFQTDGFELFTVLTNIHQNTDAHYLFAGSDAYGQSDYSDELAMAADFNQ